VLFSSQVWAAHLRGRGPFSFRGTGQHEDETTRRKTIRTCCVLGAAALSVAAFGVGPVAITIVTAYVAIGVVDRVYIFWRWSSR